MKFNKQQLAGWLALTAFTLPSLSYANTPPSISGTPDTRAAIGAEYVFQPQISDADGDAMRLQNRRVPSWLAFNASTGELRGTPSAADIGLHKNILILAKDDSSTSKLPLFNIEVYNPAPVIAGAPSTVVDAGETYHFQATATDPNGDQLTFSITNKPGWASFNKNTGIMTGTPNPTKTRNYRDIVISASDGMNLVSLPAFDLSVISGVMSTACTATIATGTSLNCQLDQNDGSHKFVLIDPPRGFSIQPKTGIVHWTPTTDQVGQHYVGISDYSNGNATQWTANIAVSLGDNDAEGIYVAPDGDDLAAGTATAPYQSLKLAADRATKGQTIYLRGGIYYNKDYGQPFANRTTGNIARITTSGTGSKPITLRPYGNEYVKLISDTTALQFKGAQHWIVENLELEGTAQDLTLADAMALWWGDAKQITGRGLSTNGSQHITFRNNIIHDFPGPGIASNGSDMITVQNNIIYNTSWWSTAGTHGVANSYLTTVSGNEGKEALTMTGNLVFANQSRIISHVFSKGNVELVIDEGNGLHVQNNTGTFDGIARVENNVLLFNGKSGVGVNTKDEVKIKNNVFYQNAQVVNAGELRLQASTPISVRQNLFHPLAHRKTMNDSNQDYSLLRGNVSTYGIDSADITIPGILQDAVFNNPGAHDFTPAAGISSDMGVPVNHLQYLQDRVNEYGINIRKPNLEVIDAAYLCRMKQQIFNDWENASTDLRNITLTDRADNHKVYRYEDRANFSCTD